MAKSPKWAALPPLHSIPAVAERLNVSPRSVQRLISSGALPAHKIGGAVRISEDDLLLMLSRSRVRGERED